MQISIHMGNSSYQQTATQFHKHSTSRGSRGEVCVVLGLVEAGIQAEGGASVT